MADKFKDIDSSLKYGKERTNQIDRDNQAFENKIHQALLKMSNHEEKEKRNKSKLFWKERKRQLEEDEKMIIERLSNLKGGLTR